MRQRRLEQIQQFESRLLQDDLWVDLTIHDISAGLLKEFCQSVIQPGYPGGVSSAIKDLMRKAIIEKQTTTAHAT